MTIGVEMTDILSGILMFILLKDHLLDEVKSVGTQVVVSTCLWAYILKVLGLGCHHRANLSGLST